METYINYGGMNAGLRLTFAEVYLIPGLGRHRLQVQAALSTANERADGDTVVLSGEVQVQGLAGGGGYLGRILPTPPMTIRRDGSYTVTLFVELTDDQIRKIEDRRTAADGAFELWLNIQLEARDSVGGLRYGSGQVQNLRVTREQWLMGLSQVGVRKVLVAELDVPDSGTNPELAQASIYYSEAQSHYYEGRYRATAESLRQTLVALVGRSTEEEATLDVMSTDLRNVSKEARDSRVGYPVRMEHVRRALKFLTDMGAHPEAGETQRVEALAQLHMVAGLMTWFGRSQ
jgi:hypothetical protein